MSSDYRTGREGKEFAYRGHSLDELQEMDVDEVAELLPARQRRSIVRGLGTEQQKLLEKVRSRDKETTADNPIRTHLRDMPILPEFVGVTFSVYNGHSFERVQVEPDDRSLPRRVPPHTKHRRTRSGRHRRDPVLEVRAPQVTHGNQLQRRGRPGDHRQGNAPRPAHQREGHSKEISREIKGETVADAEEFLQEVIDEETSVPMRQHSAGAGHRSDIDGWDAGRYPEKAAKDFLKLLENVKNNADEQGDSTATRWSSNTSPPQGR